MRGLKQLTKAQAEYTSESHLLQMRGLKLHGSRSTHNWTSVASFTDAWIETAVLEKSMKPEVVASFTDAWIET